MAASKRTKKYLNGAQLKSFLVLVDQLTLLALGGMTAMSNDKNHGIYSLVVFASIIALVVGFSFFYFVSKTCNCMECNCETFTCERRCTLSEKTKCDRELFEHLSVCIGVFFYYTGDNLPQISQHFGGLGCEENCFQVIEAVSKTFLITALVFFRLVPFLLNKFDDESEDKSNANKEANETTEASAQKSHSGRKQLSRAEEGTEPKGQKKLESKASLSQASDYGPFCMSFIIDVDALYTAVWDDAAKHANSTITYESCQLSTWVTTSASIGIICVIWSLIIIVSACKICFKNESKAKGSELCSYRSMSVCTVILVIVYPIIYLFGDNTYPFGCSAELASSRELFIALTTFLQGLIIVVLVEKLKKFEDKWHKECNEVNGNKDPPDEGTEMNPMHSRETDQ